jgi:hypothetical protein
MNNDGILRANNVIKYISDQSVVGLDIGQRIRLRGEEFERLSAAFFDELERRFLQSYASPSTGADAVGRHPLDEPRRSDSA